jgi:carbamoyltransferase
MANKLYILGISAYYHDSAVALIESGDVVFAAQEERYSRVKHDSRFPINAFQAALKYVGITADELSAVAYFEDPKLKANRIFHTYVENFPRGTNQFISAFQSTAISRKKIRDDLRNLVKFNGEVHFGNHHKSHAASAFYPSALAESAILTMDGTGEWSTSTISKGTDNRIELLAEKKFPHSLGLLYSSFTKFCGFKVNSGEYKLMGLAPYGKPKYLNLIRDHLAIHDGKGSIKLDMNYFDFELGIKMFNSKFESLLGRGAAKPDESTEQFYMDVAASIQEFTEDVVVGAARYASELTGSKNLCMAGGVALNCVANGKIFEAGVFDKIWIQPAAGDAGGALGAALSYWHEVLGNPRLIGSNKHDSQKGSYLGDEYFDVEIKRALNEIGAKFEYFENSSELTLKVAELISEEKVVGWFQGRSEYGPRALGNRSILGDPRSDETQSKMNLKIKFRESFRPFAPAVKLDKTNQWFEVHESFESPYMLVVAKVAKEKLLNVDHTEAIGLEKLKLRRSELPAITHVDNSARIQTVDPNVNPRFYELLSAFEKITGVPVLVNTSFNVRGEPIVESPRDAYLCFMRTDIDFLCIGNFLLKKTEQNEFTETVDWRNVFELD